MDRVGLALDDFAGDHVAAVECHQAGAGFVGLDHQVRDGPLT